MAWMTCAAVTPNGCTREHTLAGSAGVLALVLALALVLVLALMWAPLKGASAANTEHGRGRRRSALR